MKLVAQRVLQPATGAQAIHVFYFTHPDIWVGLPPPGLGHGALVEAHVQLGAGGNEVLSYLDIVAPDETPISTILRGFAKVYDHSPPPFHETVGNCTFESKMVSRYRFVWRAELAQLYNAAITIRTRLDRAVKIA